MSNYLSCSKVKARNSHLWNSRRNHIIKWELELAKSAKTMEQRDQGHEIGSVGRKQEGVSYNHGEPHLDLSLSDLTLIPSTEIVNSLAQASLTKNTKKKRRMRKRKKKDNWSSHAVINPLEIILILNLVLRCLPYNILLSCRLVNRDWNALAIPWIKQKQRKSKTIKLADFSKFFDDFSKCEVFPLAKLRLQLDGVNMHYSEQFFSKHGPSLEEMTILEQRNRNSGYDELEAAENLRSLRMILRRTCKLKVLMLCMDFIPQLLGSKFIFDPSEMDEVRLLQAETLNFYTTKSLNREFLDGLFALTPNIRNLGYSSGNYQGLDGEALLGAMKNVKLVGLVPAKTVSSPSSLWNAIGNTQRLTLLGIYLRSPMYQPAELDQAHHDLIKSQAEHLKLLRITNGVYRRDEVTTDASKLRLPVMKNLSNAELVFKDDPDFNLDPNSVLFNVVPIEPEIIPRLWKLVIYPRYLEMGVFADSKFQSIMDVTLLNHEKEIFETAPKLATRFPNLRRVADLRIKKFSIRDMTLFVSSWPFLHHLELELWSDPEQPDFNRVISGVPAPDDWVYKKDVEFLQFVGNPPGPSLRDFKYLTLLVLRFTASDGNDFQINQIGVYLTFLRLSPNVRVYFKGDFLISDALAAVLTAYYRNIYFQPSDKAMAIARSMEPV